MIWYLLLAIIVGMTLDLAYPEHARATLDHSECNALASDQERDPWIDLGGES